MKTQKVYNLIILDASASMNRIYSQALTGVNETLASIRMSQKKHPELQQFVTLASFSAGEQFLNRIYSVMPIMEARDITSDDYPLLGCTALYDAMGVCISELQHAVTHDDRVLVSIITDGYENASCTWSGSQIKSLVEELCQMGWTFTYIGADQDVEKVAGEMGIRNSLRFSANAEETNAMFAKERRCRNKYYRLMCAEMQSPGSSMTESTDYFADCDDNVNEDSSPKSKNKSLKDRLFGK